MPVNVFTSMPSAFRCRRLVGPACCFLVIALLGGAGVRAHEIGTTRVSVLFPPDGTYAVEIVTDAAGLVEKLAAATGDPAPTGTSPAQLQSALTGFDEAFRQQVKLAVDGVEVRPVISYAVEPGGDALALRVATIRLKGQLPPAGRNVTWSYGWSSASYALTVRREASEPGATEWLEGSQSSKPFPVTAPEQPASRFATAWRYLILGFTHIVPHGLDHILFVLGLYLLNSRARAILWQVTAFTIAHSITLGLSSLGLISVSAQIVEPLIALSIVYVAIENVYLSELKPWRIVLVFAFGLLHGMGFAGVLQELGLPKAEFVTALLMFNTGVEAGQLAVIATAFLFVGWYCAKRTWYRQRIVVPVSVLIASVAGYWTVERLFF